jgi:hypothetical protein
VGGGDLVPVVCAAGRVRRAPRRVRDAIRFAQRDRLPSPRASIASSGAPALAFRDASLAWRADGLARRTTSLVQRDSTVIREKVSCASAKVPHVRELVGDVASYVVRAIRQHGTRRLKPRRRNRQVTARREANRYI